MRTTRSAVLRRRGTPKRVPFSIDRDREAELVAAFQAGDQRAANELLRAHEGSMRAIVRPLARKVGVDEEDLMQHARMGFVGAAQRFDPTKGARLGTYALWWVLHAVREPLLAHRTVRLPAWVLDVLRKGARAGVSTDSREALVDAGLVREGSAALDGVQFAAHPMSLDADARRDAHRGASLRERLPADTPTPEEALVQAEAEAQAQRVVAEMMAALPARAADVLRRRHLVDEEERESLEALGVRWGVSRERIRQIEGQGMAMLRADARAKLDAGQIAW